MNPKIKYKYTSSPGIVNDSIYFMKLLGVVVTAPFTIIRWFSLSSL